MLCSLTILYLSWTSEYFFSVSTTRYASVRACNSFSTSVILLLLRTVLTLPTLNVHTHRYYTAGFLHLPFGTTCRGGHESPPATPSYTYCARAFCVRVTRYVGVTHHTHRFYRTRHTYLPHAYLPLPTFRAVYTVYPFALSRVTFLHLRYDAPACYRCPFLRICHTRYGFLPEHDVPTTTWIYLPPLRTGPCC